jgi:hypothetical protein
MYAREISLFQRKNIVITHKEYHTTLVKVHTI